MTDKTTKALKLAKEALYNTGNALMCLTTTRKLRPMYQEMRDDATEGCNKALAAIREALAEQGKQEPVAVISESAIGLVKLHSNGVSLPFGTQLYAAPVDAKSIRAEALEEAAKVCEQGTAYIQFQSNDCYSYAHNRAAAIRGLK